MNLILPENTHVGMTSGNLTYDVRVHSPKASLDSQEILDHAAMVHDRDGLG